MKINLILAIALATAFFAGQAQGAATIKSGPDVSTERWEGKVLTAKFRAGMCFEKNGKARGVLILRHANGNEDTYHLYGTQKNNHFDLAHSSGHHFTGTLSSTDIKGTARIKNGPKLGLSGKRIRNVPLAAEDCAPLN